MKLIENQGAFVFEHGVFGKEVIQDLHDLYGGKLSPFWHKNRLRTRDGVRADKGKDVTLVHIHGVGQPATAGRWTAMEAYRARAGVPLKEFGVEIADMRGYQEWAARYPQTVNNSEAAFRGEVLSRSPEEQVADMMQQIEAGVQGIERAAAAVERFDKEAVQAAIASVPDSVVAPPSEYPVFFAKGDGLPDAARVMARGYADLLFHAHDAEIVVAHALGVTSLNRLDVLWNEAMHMPTPLAAGQLVLNELLLDRQ